MNLPRNKDKDTSYSALEGSFLWPSTGKKESTVLLPADLLIRTVQLYQVRLRHSRSSFEEAEHLAMPRWRRDRGSPAPALHTLDQGLQSEWVAGATRSGFRDRDGKRLKQAWSVAGMYIAKQDRRWLNTIDAGSVFPALSTQGTQQGTNSAMTKASPTQVWGVGYSCFRQTPMAIAGKGALPLPTRAESQLCHWQCPKPSV